MNKLLFKEYGNPKQQYNPQKHGWFTWLLQVLVFCIF